MNSENSIFIAGLDRSGKTILRAFLASHPNIAIPEIGSNMWTYFYRRYGDLDDGKNFDRCLRDMLNYKHVAYLKPNADRIHREFWQGEPSYARLFGLFLAHYAEKEEKPRWGDQSSLNETYAQEIFNSYPGVKMIHMLRDPRDRYEASLAAWPNGMGRAGGATARWLYSVSKADLNLQRFGKDYMVIRYEDLVSLPENILRKICDFLNEEYYPAMLSMEGAIKFREKITDGMDYVHGQIPVSTNYVGRYQQYLPREDIIFIQTFTGNKLEAYQYEVDLQATPAKKKFRYYLVDFPIDFGRMIVWRTLLSLQSLIPRQFGRRIPSEMRLEGKRKESI
jgi:hypothetical protein